MPRRPGTPDEKVLDQEGMIERGQAPPQHRGSERTAADPREHRDAPTNFVPVRHVLEKLHHLHGQMLEGLSRAREASGDDRTKLLLDAWVREERQLGETLEQYLDDAGEADQLARGSWEMLDSYMQYADLETFHRAVNELAEVIERPGGRAIFDHAERAEQCLLDSLTQMSESTDNRAAGELFASLADLERNLRRRRAASQNATLDL